MCRSAYQQFVHLLRLTVLRSGAELLLSVLSGEITLFFLSVFHLVELVSQRRQQLTRMVCTSVSVAVVWYMSISWEISLPHSVLFSLSYVSLHRVDQPRNWVRA